jgi:ribonucleotide reductase beta subunit family protein with ferritin-like domain
MSNLSIPSRVTTFPITNQGAWDFYTEAKTCFWTPNEIILYKDKMDYTHNLTGDERHFVKFVLAFFSSFDGLVNINIAERFKKDLDELEVRYFYDFQVMMENIHAETYSILLQELIDDPTEKEQLLSALTEIPIIAKMGKYIERCIQSDAPFTHRLLRQACVEGIFFTGCFCVIYWLQHRGLMPGLAQSNELISRDEALHTRFAVYLIKYIGGISQADAVPIVREAVTLAQEFMKDAIVNNMLEMNYDKIIVYVQHMGDNILNMLGLTPIYNVTHEFEFMHQINLRNKTDFFLKRVTEYAKPQKQQTNDVDYDF